MTGRKNATKSLLFGYRKWNILAFRGRLMSLLAPARGMSTLRPRQEVCKRWPQRPYLACLPLKLGGFSRPSSLRTPGSHLGLISPRTRKASAAIHRTQKKWFSFSRSLAYSICWGRLSLSFTASFFTRANSINALKHCTVDWNGRRRLLENTNRFSSCEVMLPKFSLSYGNSKRSSVGRTIVQSHEP